MKNGTEQASLQSKLGSNSVGIAYFASRPLQSLTRVFCLDIVERLFGNRRKAGESRYTVGFPLMIVHISNVFVTMIPYEIIALFSLVTKR